MKLAIIPFFSRVGRKLASGEAHPRMNTGIERAANVIGSIGILACLVLQALQSFVFAPLAGATGSNFLAVLGLFVFVATMATLSFLSWRRLAAVGSILNAAFFTWLWWRFICKSTFVKSDFLWFELPALLFAVAICIRAIANEPEGSRSETLSN
jgi:hypothetical protein